MKYAALLLLLSSTCCAFARDAAPAWVQVAAPHFIVMTDGNAKQAVHLADQFERMRALLHTLAPNAKVDAPAPILVIALKERKSFEALEPPGYQGKGKLKLGGYFLHGPEKNYILLPLDAEEEHPFATVYHEYTHFAFRSAEEWMPLWLNEGLAEFIQNTDIHDKTVDLGQPSPNDVLYLRQNRLIPLPVLFRVDHQSPYYHDENKGSVFYAESWALVHYLEVTGRQKQEDRVGNYERLLSQKQDPVTAATTAFGDLGKLQKDLEDYIHAESFHFFRTASPPSPDVASFQISSVTPADADARRAEFLAYNGRSTDARLLLDAVLRQDPNNALACETLGYLDMRDHDETSARKWLTQAVKLDSKSYLAHYYYAAMSMNADGVKDAPAIESSLKTAIQLNPAFAPSYDRLAVLYGEQHEHLEDAHHMELMADQLDPSNLTYRINTAHILFEMGREEDAVRVLENAKSLAKDPAQTARLDAQLDEFRQAHSSRQAQAEMAQSARTTVTESVTVPSATGGSADTAADPQLQHVQLPPTGPKHEAHGTLHGVRCGPPAVLVLQVEGAAGPVTLYSGNYYKIEFSALNFTPQGEIHPCSDLEGKKARVAYQETADKTAAGQIVSVELSR